MFFLLKKPIILPFFDGLCVESCVHKQQNCNKIFAMTMLNFLCVRNLLLPYLFGSTLQQVSIEFVRV